MKKIIDGKLYNTDTAKWLGVASYSSPGDFHHWQETLYLKRTGEYFLLGEGGPASKYAVRVEQNSWTGGAQIIPLSYSSAAKWAEEHLDADDFQAIFGEVSEDGADVVISAKLPAATDAKLRRMAAESEVSVTAMLIKLIDNA